MLGGEAATGQASWTPTCGGPEGLLGAGGWGGRGSAGEDKRQEGRDPGGGRMEQCRHPQSWGVTTERWPGPAGALFLIPEKSCFRG